MSARGSRLLPCGHPIGSLDGGDGGMPSICRDCASGGSAIVSSEGKKGPTPELARLRRELDGTQRALSQASAVNAALLGNLAAMPAPAFAHGDRVRLYQGDTRVLWPGLLALGARGIVMFDAQYSEHVHTRSRASISRSKEIAFAPMTEADRAIFACAAAAMTTRWCLVFSDLESSHLWRAALTSTGALEYVRTGIWHKLGATPQFTGDRPAVPCEAITICHARGVEKRWNSSGSHAWWAAGEAPSLVESAHVLAEFVLGLEDVPETIIAHALNALMPRELVWSHQIVCEHGGSKAGEPRVHETQKPEDLMVKLVEAFSEVDEPVIDLTAGSSTTLVAAVRRGRRAWGVEQRPQDVETGKARLEAELAGVGYYQRQAGQVGLFDAMAVARA